MQTDGGSADLTPKDMSLRAKTLLVVAGALLGLFGGVWVATQQIVLPGFEREDARQTRSAVARVRATIEHELETLDMVVKDWASWDDTYRFVEDPGPGYVRSNLVDGTFRDLGLSVAAIVDARGRVVFGTGYDLERDARVGLPAEISASLTHGSPLLDVRPGDTESGVMDIDGVPVALVARPILTSLDEGPARGVLVMGRPIDDERIAMHRQVSGVAHRLVPIEALPPSLERVAATAARDGTATRPLDADSIAGYALVRDPWGAPSFLLEATRPRAALAQGRLSREALIVAIVLVAVLLATLGTISLERLVLARLRRLRRDVRTVEETADPSNRVRVSGRDELSDLARRINRMLEAVEHAHRDRRDAVEHHRAVVEQASDGIVLFDPRSRRVIETNEAYRRMTGFTEEELAGKTIYDLVDAPRADVTRRLETLAQRRRLYVGERRHRHRSGGAIDVEVSISLVSVGGRSVISAVIRDIEPQRVAREATRRREAILEAVAFTAEHLFRHGADGLPDALAQLGKAAEASRAYVFQHRQEVAEVYASQRCEWVAAGIEPQIDNPELQNVPLRASGFERWESTHAAGGVIHGPISGFPEAERAILAPQGIRSLVVVPIFAGDVCWGFMGFDDCVQDRAWSPAEIGALRAAAGILGAALHRERIDQQLRERTEYLSALHETTLALMERLDERELLEAIVTRAAELVGTDDGWVYLVDGERRILRFTVGIGAMAAFVGMEIAEGEGLAGRVWASGEALVVEDYGGWEERLEGFPGRFGAVVGVPLRSGGEVVGVIGLTRERGQTFAPSDVALVEGFAELASLALDNARLYRSAMEEQERSRQLADAALEGICIENDGRILEVNSAFVTMFGYPATRLIGMPLSELFPTQQQHDASGALALEGEEHAELVAMRADGAPMRVEIVLRPMTYRGRDVRVAAVRDVTERRAAEEAVRAAEQKYRGIFEHAAEGIFRTDADGRLESANPALARMLGYATPEKLFEKVTRLSEVFADPERGSQHDALLSEDGEVREFEQEVRRRGGGRMWVSENARVIRDGHGEVVGVEGTLLDISVRRRAEVGLRAAYEREREAAERLRALDEMKNAFLTAVSHELRTPLAAILGFALTLDRPDIVLPEEQVAEMVGRIAANARKLERLLGDLLDLDRIARGILEPTTRPVDLAALVRRVVEEADVGAHPVLVEAQPVVVEIDGPKTERILENLLANAVKYTPAETPVWIRVEEETDGVMLVVEDAGPGVPPELRRAVFEPFRQGDDAPAHAPGTGVGLSLVASFAELHGGRAWVQERPGGGASFRVFLPATRPASVADGLVVAGAGEGEGADVQRGNA